MDSATDWVTGANNNGYALDFDGSDDYVSSNDSSSLQDVFDDGGTISAWIKPNTTGEGGFGRIAQKGTTNTSGWEWYVDSATSGDLSKVAFRHNFSPSKGTWKSSDFVLPIATSQWTQIVVIYISDSDTNDPVYYVNGSSISLTEINTPSGTRNTDNGADLYIGNRETFDRTFNGLLDDVRIYNKALTASEIKQLYFETKR